MFVFLTACAAPPPRVAEAKPAPESSPSRDPLPVASIPARLDDEGPVTLPPILGADGSIVLTNLLKLPANKADFPTATLLDADCGKGLGLSGKAATDYDALAKRCGTNAGLKLYASDVSGKLDDKHRRDTYAFHMLGGFCYRFFAVADETVNNITVRIQRPDGDLVSMISSKNSIAIVDPDRVWCKTHDREFRLVVETNSGSGAYRFGVWARPK